MIWIILGVIFAIICLFSGASFWAIMSLAMFGIWYLMRDREDDTSVPGDIIKSETDQRARYINPRSAFLKMNSGWDKQNIVGTSYRNLSQSDVGFFKGELVAELNNKYDKYAIAVYNGMRLLGYFSKGQKKLHQYILENEGAIPVYGFIAYNSEGYYWGEAAYPYDKKYFNEINNITDEEVITH